MNQVISTKERLTPAQKAALEMLTNGVKIEFFPSTNTYFCESENKSMTRTIVSLIKKGLVSVKGNWVELKIPPVKPVEEKKAKSLIKRCLRRWKVMTKKLCDSKTSATWRKSDLKAGIRTAANCTAMVIAQQIGFKMGLTDFNRAHKRPEDSRPVAAFWPWWLENQITYNEKARLILSGSEATQYIDETIKEDLKNGMLNSLCHKTVPQEFEETRS